MRLATIATSRGPRLHVKGRSGYVDVAEATGDSGLAALQRVLEPVPAAQVDCAARSSISVTWDMP